MGLLCAVLIAIGTAGSAAACYGNSLFDGGETETAAKLDGQTDTPADISDEARARLFSRLSPGLTLAAGLVCIGIGNWRRPVPSDVRRANPWSDQPREHGDPPIGQV